MCRSLCSRPRTIDYGNGVAMAGMMKESQSSVSAMKENGMLTCLHGKILQNKYLHFTERFVIITQVLLLRVRSLRPSPGNSELKLWRNRK